MTWGAVAAGVGTFAAGMLGKPKNSKSQGTIDQTTTNNPWGASLPYLQQLMGKTGDLMNQTPTYFPGQTYLNQSPEMMQSLQGGFDTASGYNANVMPTAMQGWQQLMGGPDQQMYNDQLDNYSKNVKTNFDRYVLPSIRDEFSSDFGRRSSRAGIAEGLAAGDASNNIASYGKQLQMDFANMSNQNTITGLNMMPQMYNSMMSPYESMYNLSTAMQGDQQNQLNENINRFNYNQQAPMDWLTNINNMIMPMATAFGSSTTKGTNNTGATPAGASTGDQLMGAMSVFANMYGQNKNKPTGSTINPMSISTSNPNAYGGWV